MKLIIPIFIAILSLHAYSGDSSPAQNVVAPHAQNVVALSDEQALDIKSVYISDLHRIARNVALPEVSIFTQYEGPAIAPLVTYVQVWDPENQDPGEFGSFKVFRIEAVHNGLKNKGIRVQSLGSGRILISWKQSEPKSNDEDGSFQYETIRKNLTLSVNAANGELNRTATLTSNREVP
jgi:hypothetical protein